MDWNPRDWKYRLKITINPAKVSGTLIDFPMLITEANMPDEFWEHVKADGSDIVLTASDGKTKLKRELVSIDVVKKKLELWVKIPKLSSVGQ